MILNKIVIEGKIVSVSAWHQTKLGDRIRDFSVDAESHRKQHYCLTQFAKQDTTPTELQIGECYRFEGHVNGMKVLSETFGESYLNKIMISKAWKLV